MQDITVCACACVCMMPQQVADRAEAQRLHFPEFLTVMWAKEAKRMKNG